MLKMSVLTKFSHLRGHNNTVKEVPTTVLTHFPLCLTIHAVNLSHSNAQFFSNFSMRDKWYTIHFLYYVALSDIWSDLRFMPVIDVFMFTNVFYKTTENDKVKSILNSIP